MFHTRAQNLYSFLSHEFFWATKKNFRLPLHLILFILHITTLSNSLFFSIFLIHGSQIILHYYWARKVSSFNRFVTKVLHFLKVFCFFCKRVIDPCSRVILVKNLDGGNKYFYTNFLTTTKAVSCFYTSGCFKSQKPHSFFSTTHTLPSSLPFYNSSWEGGHTVWKWPKKVSIKFFFIVNQWLVFSFEHTSLHNKN